MVPKAQDGARLQRAPTAAFDDGRPEAPARKAKEANARLRSRAECFGRIAQISGRIIFAKNLPRRAAGGRPDPYLVVKGIRSNNSLVTLHTTRSAERTDMPQWDEPFSFDCPLSWRLSSIVGLKFLIYDAEGGLESDIGTDTFLGGADLDLHDAPSGRKVQHTFILGGAAIFGAKRGDDDDRRSLLKAEIVAVHEMALKPTLGQEMIVESLKSYMRVSDIQVTIFRARHLPHRSSVSKTNPVCVVRALTMSGSVHEIHRTEVVRGSVDPEFVDEFWHDFSDDVKAAAEPVALLFDVFDAGSDYDPSRHWSKIGDHLGSAMLLLASLPDDVRKKRRLELFGESQLVETRLQRNGKPRRLAVAEDDDEEDPTLSQNFGASEMPSNRHSVKEGGKEGFVARVLSALRGMDLRGTMTRSALLVEVSVTRVVEAMPLWQFFHNTFEVREEEDVQELMAKPDWARTLFSIPRQLLRDAEKGGRPKIATLKAKDKIAFVGGMVRGATGLINTELIGKIDPYCIIEAVTSSGDVHFVHRTRIVMNRLTPEWNESFFWAVPEKLVVKRLNFQVYDSDTHGLQALMGGEDDFLGRTTVEVSELLTGDRIREDVPLTGVKASSVQGPKLTSSTIFRRNATVSVDIFVERRVMPQYSVRKDQLDWQPAPKYHLSRQPPTLGHYEDPSHLRDLLEPELIAAAELLRVREGKRPSTASAQAALEEGSWMRPPVCEAWRGLAGEGRKPTRRAAEGPVEAEEQRQEEMDFNDVEAARARRQVEEERRRSAAAATESLCSLGGLRRSGAPEQARAASLPALRTRLRRNSGAAWHQPRQEWASCSQVNRLVGALRRKPPLKVATVGM